MEIIIIEGKSGSGKSYSLRNLNPKSGVIISPNTKPLSFRGGGAFKVDIVPELADLGKRIEFWASKGARWIIVEDFTHTQNTRLLGESFRAAGTSKMNMYARWEQFAADVFQAVYDLSSKITAKTKVVVMSHTMEDSSGQNVYKLYGKMLGNVVDPVSYCRIVLHSVVTDAKEVEKRYRFLTNTNHQYEAKSPYGMFPSDLIENDLNAVFKMIDAYDQGEQAPATETKPAAEPATTV